MMLQKRTTPNKLLHTLETQQVYSTLKRRGNDQRFNVKYTWCLCRLTVAIAFIILVCIFISKIL